MATITLTPKQRRLLKQLQTISDNEFYRLRREERERFLAGQMPEVPTERAWQERFRSMLTATRASIESRFLAGLAKSTEPTVDDLPVEQPGEATNSGQVITVEQMLSTKPPAEACECTADYMAWYEHLAGMVCELTEFQIKECKQIWDGFVTHEKRAAMMIAGTGTGKTFMAGYLANRLHASGWFKKYMVCTTPILVVTKASVVGQFTDIIRYQFGMDSSVARILNYDALRSGKGTMLGLARRTRVENGEEVDYYEWPVMNTPGLVIHDEWHAEKNLGSTQHAIMESLCYTPTMWPVLHIFASATPLTRISDAVNFALATGMTASELTRVCQDAMMRE